MTGRKSVARSDRTAAGAGVCCAAARVAFRSAFSLLELIGVLAILIILASLLLPRIMKTSNPTGVVEAVSKARIEEVLTAVRALKTAAGQHCARFGSLASRNGTGFPVAGTYENYDAILLSEQLLDRPFSVRLGSHATVRLVNVSSLSALTPVDGSGCAYDLGGQGNNSVAGAAYLLEAMISGVSEPEAKALNDGLDGPALGAGPGESDRKGSVTYARIPAGARGQVYIYITHH